MNYPEPILKKLQETEVAALKRFDEVCRKNGLEYTIDGGTCLGAIRHDGHFIPWDDDIDVAMKANELKKLLSHHADEFGPEYRLRTYKDSDYYLFWPKLCVEGTRFQDADALAAGYRQGIFVDIFPMVRVSSDPKIAHRQRKRAVFWQRMAYIKAVRTPKFESSMPHARIFSAVCTVAHFTVAKLFSRSFVERRFWAAYDESADGPWVNACSIIGAPRPSEVMYPPSELTFEGLRVMAPSNPVKYLENVYGDWKRMPPPEKRHMHAPVVLDFGDGVNVVDGPLG